ncbi:MAG TPA: ATP-dependent DNA helicase [Solirubrobacterales bacterium]|jgi:DNA helicase-2/ATP-dependent DNA helicase PcrA|nr:ATP-dependent DNA helicase [Solirubrobacterales bacterium]
MLALAESQERVVRHGKGPLLVSGAAGSGKTEALARRLAWLAAAGTEAERVLLLAAAPATAERLQERADALLDRPREELWIGTWETLAERLLREHATAAGLDPFFDVLGPAERLAMLLDRLDDLPLRHHDIRGNPAGLLARLLEQIDELKTGSEPTDADLAELVAAHDEILADACALDRGDLFLTLNRLLHERPEARQAIADSFRYVMVDELEDTTPAQRAILAALAEENPNHLYALEEGPNVSAADPVAGVGGSDRSLGFSPEEEISLEEPAGRKTGRRSRSDPPTPTPPADLRFWCSSVHAEVEVVVLRDNFRDPPIRFWRCTNERAQAQAVAREAEHLLATGAEPEAICVLVEDPTAGGGAVAAAMEERGIPFHVSGPAALFQRPEVRDAIAWLRVLADPADSAAAARALTRPPIELRSADLARLATISRRRKLDMVSACEAALESPQIPPEARERIQAFLKLYGAASAALEERRADVFVRRLIEAVGLRRQRLFAAQPEVAERLLGLARLAELAAAWARRQPHSSTRDFIRHLSAVADAGVEPAGIADPPAPGAVRVLARRAVKGMEFEHVFVLGLEDDAGVARIGRPARAGLVLARVERGRDREGSPSRFYAAALAAANGEEESHGEELFGPAEGLHATYRMLREEVLEASWRAGRELSEPRLDTAIDVNRAIARYLELLKLAALAQRPGEESTGEALEAVNGLLRQVATPEQQAELDASALDAYLLDSEREGEARRRLIAARREPSLEAFLPRRGDGALSLSASDLDLYLTCPLKYKFARVFGIPQEPTINQRFGILIHNVLERFHKEAAAGEEDTFERLMDLFEAGWRRTGFGSSDDELQFRDRAREAMRLYWERERESEGEPVWLERKFDMRIGEHHVRGRVDRVDRLPGGGYELIDYKTGERKSEADLESDLQLALYRIAAREAWEIEADAGSYYYVLDAEKVAAPVRADDAERVERTVLQVGEGVLGQDFEPRPSPSVCSWCDYRLVCPAAEG